ncbi:MAG TPA: hypothetical protein VFK61_04850 [Candidatus Limnocylindria bacterium]|nr:hypothetical protein [Candidatus Limnocylindria bacterium]
MTEQKALKRRVRNRMAKTGERYTAARRQVLSARRTATLPAVDNPRRLIPPPGMTGDALMRQRTGRDWAEWIGILDAWGAESRPHIEIARWLNREQRVDGWWSQQVTVGYEIAIGRRVTGQRGDGSFSATATRTLAATMEDVVEAVTDAGLRKRWLPRAPLVERPTRAERTARFDWEGNGSRVVFWFENLGDAKCRVAMEHQRLADVEEVGRMKAYWRAALLRLKEQVGS